MFYYLGVLAVFGYMAYLLILSLDYIGFCLRVFGWRSVALLALLYIATGLIGYYLGKSRRFSHVEGS